MIQPNDKAKAVLDSIKYATVATVSNDGQPWNSPVYCVYDEGYTLYWASSIKSQHSQNIYANNKVFIVVYDSTVPWGTSKGVFIRAEAAEVTDRYEIAKACELRRAHVPGANQSPDDFTNDKPRRIYKAVPQKIWMNDADQVNGNFIDVRKEAEV